MYCTKSADWSIRLSDKYLHRNWCHAVQKCQRVKGTGWYGVRGVQGNMEQQNLVVQGTSCSLR